MPVLGLPRAAEDILTTLLVNHEVTSWKITGEGNSTVFVLRMSSAPQSTGSPLRPSAWRRKAPSDVRRDVRRAILRQERHVNDTNNTATPVYTERGNSDNNRNAITRDQQTDKKEAETVTTTSQASETSLKLAETSVGKLCNGVYDVTSTQNELHTPLHTPPREHAARDSYSETDMGQNSDTLVSTTRSQMLVNKPEAMCRDDDNNILPEDSEVDMEAEMEEFNLEELATVAGIKVTEVDACIGDLDVRKKRELRDESRNGRLNKIVLDHRGGKEILTGETDDFIVTYDCRQNGLFSWHIKDPRREDPYINHTNYCIKTWPEVDTEQYADEVDRLFSNVDLLCCLFRSRLS